MRINNRSKFNRMFGDETVLAGLERLGKKERTIENLVKVGFPQTQLEQAVYWYIKDASTPVLRYAGKKMEEGLFEEESLLQLFCRFFECNGGKLERSPWFYSKKDYLRFNKAIINKVGFHVARLEEGQGEERWGTSFLNMPFDMGMEKALHSLWEEICQSDYFWKSQSSYIHLRAAQLLIYLKLTVEITDFSEHRFNYNWEQSFLRIFSPVLGNFKDALERGVRSWQEMRRKQTTRKFSYHDFASSQGEMKVMVNQALHYLEMEPATASLKGLQRSFRKLSKTAHPDRGGNPEEFRRLSQYKDIVESWLKQTHAP